MNILSYKFFESIEAKNRELAIQYGQQLAEDMDAEQKMKILVDMSELISSVSQGATGTKSDFTHDFVRGVCSETVVNN
jgi:hypothetical protein